MRGSGCGSDKHRDQFGDCLAAFGRTGTNGSAFVPRQNDGPSWLWQSEKRSITRTFLGMNSARPPWRWVAGRGGEPIGSLVCTGETQGSV
jgi:hypothetical protein